MIDLTNIVSMARVGTIDADLRIKFQEAMESAEIDRTETCFAGKGVLSYDELVEYMSQIDETYDEAPW